MSRVEGAGREQRKSSMVTENQSTWALGLLVRALTSARPEMGSQQKAGGEERPICLLIPLAAGREQPEEPEAGDQLQHISRQDRTAGGTRATAVGTARGNLFITIYSTQTGKEAVMGRDLTHPCLWKSASLVHMRSGT